MTIPPINPLDSWWQAVYSECPDCFRPIKDDMRTSSDIIELYCQDCHTTWYYTIGA